MPAIRLISALMVLGAVLLLSACTSVTPAATVGSAQPAPPSAAATAAPAATPGAPVGTSTQLLPDPSVSGERMYTLGQPVEIEDETQLEVLEGWIDPPGPEGTARYTFLVRFSYPVPQSPDPFGVSAGYYNAIGFSVRDDQGFEYAVIQGSSQSREPELLFGNLNEGQDVQGWVTFEAPAETAYLDLVYGPVSRDPATFRVIVP